MHVLTREEESVIRYNNDNVKFQDIKTMRIICMQKLINMLSVTYQQKRHVEIHKTRIHSTHKMANVNVSVCW